MRHRIKEKSRLLPVSAIEIMTKWYEEHYTNPYPMLKECEELAELGNVTVSQVKQWFVNVRRRTHNQYRKRRATNDRSNKESIIHKVQDSSIGFSETLTNDSFVTHEYSPYEIINQDEEKNPFSCYKSNQSLHQKSQQSSISPSNSLNYYENSPASIMTQNYNQQLNYLFHKQNFLNPF
jgi:hypothetical protein